MIPSDRFSQKDLYKKPVDELFFQYIHGDTI